VHQKSLGLAWFFLSDRLRRGLAPIVTGYVVDATGSLNTAFAVAGALALVGAVAALVLVRGTLGEYVRPSRANPRLAT